MYRRLYAYAAPLTALVMTGGCAQMTRHSNMVLFGTNTSVGLRIGASAANVPEIQLGYSRQEAVALPVVANTTNAGSANGQNDLLQPCDLTSDVRVTGGRFAVHPCSLVAVNGGAMDSYSVLASFGANFDASAGSSTTAKGGLAQYFSTGMAAQILALTGGASVVAVGEAARTQAANPPSTSSVRALFGNAPAYERGIPLSHDYDGFMDRLIQLIRGLATDAEAATKIGTFETNAGIPSWMSLRSACTTRDACVAAIRASDNYRQAYVTRQQQMDGQLNSL